MSKTLSTAEALDEGVPGELIASSKGRPWRDVLAQVFIRRAVQDSLIIPAVPEPLIVWVVSGEARVEERELGGTWMASEVGPGDFFLTTSPRPCELRWQARGQAPFRVLHLYLGLSLMQRAAADVVGPGATFNRLREVSGGADAVLTSLLGMLHEELLRLRSPSTMFVQGLTHALAVHLVRNFASDAAQQPTPHGGLPAFKINRALSSMQSRLDEELDLHRLAREAGLSDAHFSRAFKKSTGFTPSQYLVRMRMELARRLLRETDRPVVQIGLDVGYSSPSHFAQVFRREVGVLPSEYRGSNPVA
jgi:AraC family transcriptional regulator